MLDLIGYHSACAGIAASLAGGSAVNPTDPVIYVAHPFTSGKYLSTWNFQKAQFDARTFGTYASSSPTCLSVSPSSNGRLAAILTGGVNKLVIFNSDTEEVIASIDGTFSKIIGWRPTVNDVLAVIDGSGYIKFYDTTTWVLVSGAYSSTRIVQAGAWSPDGAYILLGFTTSTPGYAMVSWSTMTALPNSGTSVTGIGACGFLKGRTGTDFAALLGQSASSNVIYGVRYSSGNAYCASTGSTSVTGIRNRIVTTSSVVGSIIANRSDQYTINLLNVTVASALVTAATRVTGTDQTSWTGGGTLLDLSPASRYVLARVSQSSGLSKQFNYFDLSVGAYKAGFDTGLTVNDFRWDPRGSL